MNRLFEKNVWWPPTSSICYNKSSQSLFSYDSSVKEREQKLLGMTTFIITNLKVNTDPATQQLDETAWMNPDGQMVQYEEEGEGKGGRPHIRPGLKLAPDKLCTCVRGWDIVNVPNVGREKHLVPKPGSIHPAGPPGTEVQQKKGLRFKKDLNKDVRSGGRLKI